MTTEEMRRIYDLIVQEPVATRLVKARPYNWDEEYMAERDWLKKVFMSPYLDGTEKIDDRHPRAHYMGRWPKRKHGGCDRYERPCPSAPAELTAGDTSQLDNFLSGFAKQEV